MTETLVSVEGSQVWTSENFAEDLRQQGFESVIVERYDVGRKHPGVHEFDCILGENKFVCTWLKDTLMLLTMGIENQSLVLALMNIVGYEPFCRYTDRGGLVTYGWSKTPDKSFTELQSDPEVHDLARIEIDINYLPPPKGL